MLKYVAVVLLLVSSPSYANETIRILNSYSPTGAFFKLGNHIHETNPDKFGQVEKVASCSAVANIFETTTEPAIVLWDPVLESITVDEKCREVITAENFITLHGAAFMHVCTKKESGKDLDHFLSGNAKIGYTGDIIYTILLQNNINSVKSNATMVPYESSTEYMAAFEVDEIDYIYTTRYDDTMSCILTTDPNRTDVATVASYSDDIFATGGMKIAVFGVNVDVEEIKALLNSTAQLDTYKELFKSYSIESSLVSREEQFEAIQNEIASYKSQIQ
jgi:hypothetical protein